MVDVEILSSAFNIRMGWNVGSEMVVPDSLFAGLRSIGNADVEKAGSDMVDAEILSSPSSSLIG